MNGQEPTAMNLGMEPVFPKSTGGRITYARFFYLYVPIYTLLGVGLALSLTMLLPIWKRRVKEGET